MLHASAMASMLAGEPSVGTKTVFIFAVGSREGIGYSPESGRVHIRDLIKQDRL